MLNADFLASILSVKYILVDLDNTLFFTNEANNLAYRKALEDDGIYLTDEQYQIILSLSSGRIDHSIIYTAVPDFADQCPHFEAIIKRKERIFYGFLGFVKPNKTLIKTLYQMKDEALKTRTQYQFVLVTNAKSKRTHEILDFFQLDQLFDCVIHGNHLCNKFELAIKCLNSEPNEVIIFDDDAYQIKQAVEYGVPQEQTFLISTGV